MPDSFSFSPISIAWPNPSYEGTTAGLVMAAGRMDSTVSCVWGECRSVLEPDLMLEGGLVGIRTPSEGTDLSGLRRWRIMFRIPKAGTYDMTIFGMDHAGRQVQPVTTQFTVQEPVERNPTRYTVATVSYPSNNDNITAEKDDFFAYGDLYDKPLGRLTFRDSGLSVIEPLHVESDHLVLQFWSASYPPLSPGTYSLHVEDTEQAGQTVTNLTVE